MRVLVLMVLLAAPFADAQQASLRQTEKLEPLPAELAEFADAAIFLLPGPAAEGSTAATPPPLELLPNAVKEQVAAAEAWLVRLEAEATDVPARDAQIEILPAVIATPGDTPAETPLQADLLTGAVPLNESRELEHWGDVDHSLGVSLMQLGLFTDAEYYLQRCLRLRVEELGPHHVLTRCSLFALERLYQRWGQPERAKFYRPR
ncbi:MAG: tetratricopeptide repeat protein [Planctomycetota bacterium]